MGSRENVILIGFMGTGKTAVGKRVASRLGRRFVDTDVLIEERAGRSIPRIFAEGGEPAFRRLEAEVIAQVAAGGGRVVATGGGVVLSSANMACLRRNGVIIALRADAESILARVGRGEYRPLLGDAPEENIRRLLRERDPLYQEADLVVETSALSVEDAVERVVSFVTVREQGAPAAPHHSPAAGSAAPAAPQPVRADLGARGYDICIGRGILAQAGEFLDRRGVRGRLALLTHPRIDTLYGRALAERLRGAGYEVVTVTVAPSESSKSLRVAGRVYNALVDARFDRGATLLALGGGVAGDLGGFVAATFLRGIAWVAAPTTLLAQVDASIGGKTGVNFRAKNLVGAVHQPVLVLSDIDALRTLSRREFRSGMAEVIKTGVIGDPDLFDVVERRGGMSLRRDPDALCWVVRRCAAYKAGVIAGDEREAGPRMVLNYGHTIGHAIEAAAGYRGLTHGEAVAVGMTLEARLAVRLGLCDVALLDRQTEVLRTLGLPVRLSALCAGNPPGPERVREAMAHDKKTSAGRLRFVLPRALGSTVIKDDVPPGLAEEIIAHA